jgi:hypothetical protein
MPATRRRRRRPMRGVAPPREDGSRQVGGIVRLAGDAIE